MTSTIGRYRTELTVVGLLVGVLLGTHLFAWVLPSVFAPLTAQATDRLFELRDRFEIFRPPVDDFVVYVDIDDGSLRDLGIHYVDRPDYAQLIAGLGRAGVAAQFHDHIFSAPRDNEGDERMLRATAEAPGVYFGMAVGLSAAAEGRAPVAAEPRVAAVVERARWSLEVDGDPRRLPRSTLHFVTFRELSEAAAGVGFLDLVPDRDGVYRRVSLLARDGDGYVPSLPLLVVCRYLGVTPDRVEVVAGRSVTLRGARYPGGGEARNIRIPVDRQGRMIVNFVTSWQRMTHYPFSVVYEASDDRFMMEDLRELLEGKIAVVSTITTGSGDIGAVPIDHLFPLSGLMGTVMRNVLTADFLRGLSGWEMLFWIELPLLILLAVAGLRLSNPRFVGVASGLIVAYVLLVAVAFLYGDLILAVPVPVIFIVLSTIAVAGFQFHVETQARARLDRELAVARDIQVGTWPSKMPVLDGYDIAGFSRPADATGGDTFDFVPVGDGRLMLLLGDATGHGIGPALSVTQVRSMLRIAMRLDADLDSAFSNINDQLAQDLSSNRFVTAFLGRLDTDSHSVEYHAGGQGPLLHFHAAGGKTDFCDSTTMPMGLMEGTPSLMSRKFELAPGDILGLMTDGIFEYENVVEEQFSEERVAELIREHQNEPMTRLIEILVEAVEEFGRNVPQADDMTIVLVRRSSAS